MYRENFYKCSHWFGKSNIQCYLYVYFVHFVNQFYSRCVSDEGSTCSPTVGRIPNSFGPGGNNWGNLMVSTAFPCDGYVVSWTFYRALAFGSVYVGVFRQSSETEFTLIEKTLLPEGLTGEQTYQPDPPILVRRGDFIGVFHSRNTPQEVLARSADEVSDARYQNFYVSFMDEDIQRGTAFSINDFVNSENQASFAVQADMSYVGVPGIYIRYFKKKKK